MNLLFKNITLISPSDNINGVTDVYIRNGVIESTSVQNNVPDDVEIVEGNSLLCAPGFFDMHVHFRYPGQTEKEDLPESISSGAESAANGGFTGVLCMPNTKPPVDNAEVLKDLLNKSDGNIVDVYASACVSKNREGMVSSDYFELQRAGALALTDDGSPVYSEALMRTALGFSSKSGLPVLQHAEDYKAGGSGVIHKGKVSENLGVAGIPHESETEIVSRDLKITADIKGALYHLQHISCGGSVDLIRKAKADGLSVTAEVCPHHFVLTDTAVEKEGSNAKMNPPLRTESDIKNILDGLRDNIIEIICTDHAPHTAKEKSADLKTAPFGIIGLETCAGLSFTYLVKTGVISLSEFIRKISVNPRKLLNLPEIRIRKGEKANLTILNINKEWTVDSSKFKSKSRNTPFNGFKLICKPFAVINNNQIFYSIL